MMNQIKSTQSDPPNFGKARMIPKFIAELLYKFRVKKSLKILKQQKSQNLEKGKISIVILSCKRLKSLRRLVESLKFFFKEYETYKNIEIVLVDNGSGEELISWAKGINFFDRVIAIKENIGMCSALNNIYKDINSEFTMLIEDDFIIDYKKPFLLDCVELFNEFAEIGIIRLKNQNNWGKSFRNIAPLRKFKGISFWTWLPSFNYRHNVWCAGSVLFRQAAYNCLGPIKCGEKNPQRSKKNHQGVMYEEIFGKKFNKIWLAAKIYNCYPFIQLDQDSESPGWND